MVASLGQRGRRPFPAIIDLAPGGVLLPQGPERLREDLHRGGKHFEEKRSERWESYTLED